MKLHGAFGGVPGMRLRSHPFVAPYGNAVPLCNDTCAAAGVFSSDSPGARRSAMSARAWSFLCTRRRNFESKILATTC